MKRVNIKISNLGLPARVMCRRCGSTFDPTSGKCPKEGCRGEPELQVLPNDGERSTWEDEEYVCHGKSMETTGLGDCNGWRCRTCGHEVEDVASFKMNSSVAMSAMLIDMSKQIAENGTEVMFVPLELDSKVIGHCKIEGGKMAYAHIKDEEAADKILDKMNSGTVSFKTKNDKTHLIGEGNDRTSFGTHPTYGNGECGWVGKLTDCISSLTCPACRDICRKNGVSEWMESEWKKIDESRAKDKEVKDDK